MHGNGRPARFPRTLPCGYQLATSLRMRATAHCLAVPDPANDVLLCLIGCLRSPALGCCCCLLQAASTMSNVPLIVGVTVGAAAITMFAVKAAMSAKRRRGPRRTGFALHPPAPRWAGLGCTQAQLKHKHSGGADTLPSPLCSEGLQLSWPLFVTQAST